jgi:hypothetical protein
VFLRCVFLLFLFALPSWLGSSGRLVAQHISGTSGSLVQPSKSPSEERHEHSFHVKIVRIINMHPPLDVLVTLSVSSTTPFDDSATWHFFSYSLPAF